MEYRDTVNNLNDYNYEKVNYTSDDIDADEHDVMGRSNSDGICQQF